jgi:hypothetical protein
VVIHTPAEKEERRLTTKENGEFALDLAVYLLSTVTLMVPCLPVAVISVSHTNLKAQQSIKRECLMTTQILCRKE